MMTSASASIGLNAADAGRSSASTEKYVSMIVHRPMTESRSKLICSSGRSVTSRARLTVRSSNTAWMSSSRVPT